MSLEDLKRERPAEPTLVTVKELLSLISTSNASQRELKTELEKTRAEHDRFVEMVAIEFAKHAAMITKLYSDIRILESTAGNVRIFILLNFICKY